MITYFIIIKLNHSSFFNYSVHIRKFTILKITFTTHKNLPRHFSFLPFIPGITQIHSTSHNDIAFYSIGVPTRIFETQKKKSLYFACPAYRMQIGFASSYLNSTHTERTKEKKSAENRDPPCRLHREFPPGRPCIKEKSTNLFFCRRAV